MEDELKIIIKEYIETVNVVCLNLLEGLKLKTKSELLDYTKTHHEMEFKSNGINYMYHGRGCKAFSNDFFIDWDFGFGSRWCGINPWLLARTLEQNKSNQFKCYDGNRINTYCERAVLDGEMFKKYDLYYFTIPDNETFTPDFPIDFDTLVVEDFKNKWIIHRNKLVDRFLKKSQRVHQNVGKNLETYTIRFLLEDKEVYSIPFDDIAYPKKAVEIMFELIKISYSDD